MSDYGGDVNVDWWNCYTKTNILIHESKGGYHTPWDGNNLRGREMPIGKYVYEVDLHGDGVDVRIGTVSIFR